MLATSHAVVCNVAVAREECACRKSVGAIIVTVNPVDSFQFLPFKILVLISPSEVLKVAASQFSPTANTITVHVHRRTKFFFKSRVYSNRICFSSVASKGHAVSYVFLATTVTGSLECVQCF